MAQLTETFQGDHADLAARVNTLAAANTVQIITKTTSAGSYIIVYDNVGGTGQVGVVIKGDPDKLTAEVNALIALGNVVEIVANTFSAANYVVVYT